MKSKHEKQENENAEQEPQPAAPAEQEVSIEQLKEQQLRLLADFENARKRLQREKEEFAKFSKEGILRDLLAIVDSLAQAMAAVDKQPHEDAVVKGVHLIHRQLMGLLEKEGVKPIPAVGAKFDPNVHESVGHVPAESPEQDGKVVMEVQTGYWMHGKILRPALVKVAKAEPQGLTDEQLSEWGKGGCGCD